MKPLYCVDQIFPECFFLPESMLSNKALLITSTNYDPLKPGTYKNLSKEKMMLLGTGYPGYIYIYILKPTICDELTTLRFSNFPPDESDVTSDHLHSLYP